MSETTADQKTEEPTARRLEKALEEGQIAFSSELMGGIVMLAGVFFFLIFGKWFFDTILATIRQRLTQFSPMIEEQNTLLSALKQSLLEVALAGGAMMMFVVVFAAFAGTFQTRFNLTFKPLNLDWKKINPASGVKRIFSSRSVTRGLVAIAKSTAIIITTWYLVRAKLTPISRSGALGFEEIIGLGCQLILATGLATAVLMVVIGFVDYIFQRWKQHQELKMSQQEIRDENKDLEGDPLIKARIRRLQNERVRSRMLEAVPQATVVVTNPTHYAVALRYERSENEAPVVVAKGKDALALKIIEVAKQNGVAVVQRKPLARFMYANVEIGQPIPFELYQAIAEILNFIRKAQSYVS